MTEQDKTAGLWEQFPALSERLGEGKLQIFGEKAEVALGKILNDMTFLFSLSYFFFFFFSGVRTGLSSM